MTRNDLDLNKSLLNTRKSIDLMPIPVGFWGKIYYFFNPYAKQHLQYAERTKKNTKRLRNQRYYAGHSEEIKERRRDYYAETGK